MQQAMRTYFCILGELGEIGLACHGCNLILRLQTPRQIENNADSTATHVLVSLASGEPWTVVQVCSLAQAVLWFENAIEAMLPGRLGHGLGQK